MKTILLRLTLATLLSVLASCTTYYKSPSTDATTHAAITNYGYYQGISKHESYKVNAVDGVPINYEWSFTTPETFYVTPGPHRIEIAASQSGLSSPGFYRSQTELTFDAKAGRSYQPKGYIEGPNFVTWIEDKGTGKNVSGKSVYPLQAVRQGPPTIFIPPVMLQ